MSDEEGLSRARELFRRGALASSVEAFRDALETGPSARGLWELARVELHRGAPDEALTRCEAALQQAAEEDAPREAASARAARAEALAWLGQGPAATEQAMSVLEDAQASPTARALAGRVLGQIAAAGGDTDSALRRYDEAIGALRQLDAASPLGAVTSLDAAEALLDRDGPVDVSAAASRLADARDHVEGLDLEGLRPRLDLLLARARGATGDPDGAVEDLEALESRLPDDAPSDLEWQVHACLARLHEMRGAEFVARRRWEHAVETLERVALGLSREQRERFWTDARRQLARRKAKGERRRSAPPRTEPFADGRLARLLEVLKRLASETDLDRLLERITDCAIELSGAERGFVLLTSAQSGGTLLAHTVRDAQNPDDPHVAFSRSIAEAVLIDGEPILTVDARTDQRLSEYVSVHKLSLRSVACLPIRGRSGTVGVLYLEHRARRGRFGEADLDLLLAFADQAAIALEKARLLKKLETRSEELEQANDQLGQANEEIARLLDAKTQELAETRSQLKRAHDALREANDRHGIVGRSQRMRRVFAVVDRVQDADVPLVIQGESGTGKELVARAVHFGGTRAKKPFVALNCAAIPEALLESELFGHVRGAFTGAERDRQGVIVRASGGTLFLDEVGDMPAKMQIDLLRVLQERKVRPVGGEDEIDIDVRVIAASNKSLADLVQRGSFREDLYYRLNVVELWLPPLRERVEDIPLLCEHFLNRFAERDGGDTKRISREAIQRIAVHALPGNVRQLEHLLLNAWVMCEGDVIEPQDLALADDGSPLSVPPRIENALARAAAPVSERPRGAEAPPSSIEEFKELERQRILEALETHNWNRVQAAKALGIARRTFYRRLKEYDIL